MCVCMMSMDVCIQKNIASSKLDPLNICEFMTMCKLKEENMEKLIMRPFSLTSVPRHY